MILKASQRSGGRSLAVHLMNADDNEHVRVHELRGFASDNLKGAFKEAEAISLGTKCRDYLFSLSLSPPADARVDEATFQAAISKIEDTLGLQGQPRAVVFHEKEGRRHAHCVWSRIDAETMTARRLGLFQLKLRDISRELYLEHGWTLPRGLENPAERNPTNFSLAEWQQAKRQEIDPRWLKSAARQCWEKSDNAKSLTSALEERGLFLAKGDRRGAVVLDHKGEVWALPRLLGLKTKAVQERLGDGSVLPSVADTQKTIAARMTPAIRRHIEEARETFRAQSAKLGEQKTEMTRLHRQARQALAARQQEEWLVETKDRAARLPTGLRGLWHRITGKYQEVRQANEQEAEQTQLRHGGEREALIATQQDQRSHLQAEFKKLRTAQAEQLLSLRADIGRFVKFQRQSAERSSVRDRSPGLGLER